MIVGLLTAAGLSKRVAGILAPVLTISVVCAVVWALWARGSEYRDERDLARAEKAAEVARHAVTRQSVSTLEAVIEDLNERALARAEAYAAAQGVAAKRSAELAKLSQESDKRIAALRQAAREQYNGDCPVPDAIRELAEGL